MLALLMLSLAIPSPAGARITIAGEGTANATLLYHGAPMFKIGPVPEQAIFGLELGKSPAFDLIDWFDRMTENRLAYGRVYPDSGYGRLAGPPGNPVPADAPGRIFPFEIARWRDGRPVADLARFNPAYWANMSRVIREAEKRGIVLQLQLYQRAYFSHRDYGWKVNFFNPVNNVNRYPTAAEGGDSHPAAAGRATSGYAVFEAMARDTPWRHVHRQWVEHILNAIGDSGNVIIDLMNEGSFNQGISRRWIESTLNIIDRWERATGREIPVGMDFDHLYKAFLRSGDRVELDYVLTHPRLDVLIAEGAESHVVPTLTAGHRQPLGRDLARSFRERYRKPLVSTNSPSYGPHEELEKLHLYQWHCLLSKVQGCGVYSKRYPLAWGSAPVSDYADRSRILMRFFDTITDYAALAPLADQRVKAPGAYRLALASPAEAVVYLHAGIGNAPIEAGAPLRLSGLDGQDGVVTVEALDPRGGRVHHAHGRIESGTLTTRVPFGAVDVALRIELE